MTRDLVVAVDIGGTTLKGALVDVAGTVVFRLVAPTPARAGGEAVLCAVVALARELAGAAPGRGGRVVAAGLVTPGRVDPDTGVVEYAANLGWRDMPLAAAVSARLGIPVVVDHDARAAARAEAAAADRRECLFVSLGTGIGAAMVSGRLARSGATNQAGEIGHAPVYPRGEPCACGQRGCLEMYASASAIGRRYAAASQRGAWTVAAVQNVTAAQVVGLLGHDPAADQVWGDAVTALAAALTTCTLLLDPEVIVLGGGLAMAGAALVDPLVADLATALTWRAPPPVLLAALGADAGLLGAGQLAWAAACADGVPGPGGAACADGVMGQGEHVMGVTR